MFLYCVFISVELCNLVHEEFMIGSAGMGVWNIIAYAREKEKEFQYVPT